MNNQEYILKSEMRKMIADYNPVDVRNPDDFHYNEGKKAFSEELLSDLDNLSGVSGWIPVTEDMERKTYLLWAKEGFYFIGHYDGASNNYCRDGNDGELVIATHYMPLPPHP